MATMAQYGNTAESNTHISHTKRDCRAKTQWSRPYQHIKPSKHGVREPHALMLMRTCLWHMKPCGRAEQRRFDATSGLHRATRYAVAREAQCTSLAPQRCAWSEQAAIPNRVTRVQL